MAVYDKPLGQINDWHARTSRIGNAIEPSALMLTVTWFAGSFGANTCVEPVVAPAPELTNAIPATPMNTATAKTIEVRRRDARPTLLRDTCFPLPRAALPTRARAVPRMPLCRP